MNQREVALDYFRQGANIVLLKDKKPLHEWQKWIKERQTQQDFDGLPWSEANQYAVVCGTQLDNGLFLCAIDHDVKNLDGVIVAKGSEVLKQLPVTQLEETPSKGLHLIYFSKNKPKTVSTFHNIAAVELLGEAKLCIMSPSQGYSKLNDNTPTTVQDLKVLFNDALSSVGIEAQKTQTWFDREDLTAKPYRKNHPLCIRELLKGAHKGQRNEYAIRLSSYFINFRQLDSKRAFQELAEWNRLNFPSLSEMELRNIFESAIRGRYVFGCEDPILNVFCKSDIECSLRKKAEVSLLEQKSFDADTETQIIKEVQRVRDAENQLEALKSHLDNIIVGEDNTKQTVAVLLRSAKEPHAESKQIIILKATEGAGKSSLLNKLVKGYKVKEVGRFSAHALDYTNLAGYEILLLKELGSMDEEKQGVSTVKFLSADDRGYTVEITAKDEETGKFTTEQYKIPPITVASTTTRLILDPQFERRAWAPGLDETSEQTDRIRKWKATNEKQNAEKMLGIRKLTDYEFSTEVYRRFVESYEPKTIIIPFPEKLLEVLGKDVLRVRGDFDKLLGFAKLYGSFNLKRLKEIKPNIYVLSAEVAVEALKVALEPLATMLSKIDTRSKQLLGALKEIIDIKEWHDENGAHEEKITYTQKGAVIDKKVRERIAVSLGKSEKTIRDFFNQLENSGYVSGNQKKPKTHTLLYNVEAIETKIGRISAKIESADNLILEMQKEASEWLRTGLENFSLTVRKESTDEGNGSVGVVSRTADKKISNPSLMLSQVALTESESEDWQIAKSPMIQADSSGLISCPFCRDSEKTMCFVSHTDLDRHVEAFHTGRPNHLGYVS